MRNDVCKNCGQNNWYVKGTFAYCRFCHAEAQKRYAENKRMGINYELKNPAPTRRLSQLLKSRASHEAAKTHCPQGHAYTDENTRVIEQRPGIINRKCRACERNAKRVAYGLAPEPLPSKLTDLLDS